MTYLLLSLFNPHSSNLHLLALISLLLRELLMHRPQLVHLLLGLLSLQVALLSELLCALHPLFELVLEHAFRPLDLTGIVTALRKGITLLRALGHFFLLLCKLSGNLVENLDTGGDIR